MTVEEMINNAKCCVVINDGQYCYPVKKSDLLPGDCEESISRMTGHEYSEWCTVVPADESVCPVGSHEMVDLCLAMRENGADYWYVGR